VPLVVPHTWIDEPAPPPPPRFLSQDEEPQEERAFFRSASPVMVEAAEPADLPRVEEAIRFEPEEQEAGLLRPQFDELAEEPAYALRSIDYAPDFVRGPRDSSGLQGDYAPPATPLFAEIAEEPQRDLDVPAFMRRMKF
jgi:hypothetical protein